VELFVITAVGKSVVRGRSVELRKEQVPSFAVRVGPGDEKVETVREGAAVAGAPGVGSKARGAGGDLRTRQAVSRPRYNVDDGEVGVASVQGGTGAADDFDSVDQVQIDAELLPDVSEVVQTFVGADAIEKEQNPGVPITGSAESTNSDVGVIAVAGDVEPWQRSQHIRQRAVTVLRDFRGGDDAHKRWDIPRFLRPLRAGDDDLDLHQPFEVHREGVDWRLWGWGRRLGSGEAGRNERTRDQEDAG
jgi:hypothetical protein